MPKSFDENELIKDALKIYDKMKEHYRHDEHDCNVRVLFETIKNTPLANMIDFEDLDHAIYDLTTTLDLHFIEKVREISSDEFVKQFRSRVLSTKVFDYYLPVYLLYNLPKGMQVSSSTVILFEALPERVRESLIARWQRIFVKDDEFLTIDDYVKRKSESVYLHFSFPMNGENRANRTAENIANDSLTILGFAFGGANFNLIDLFYTVDGSEHVQMSVERRDELPYIGMKCSVDHMERVKTLTSIFINSQPSQIEEKIRNALRIYQLKGPNDQVRFVLLMTSLESLLMTRSDKDYILWRLAEKAAFILGGNKREINNYIRDAYDKRSAFIHGSNKETETIKFEDVIRLEGLIYDLVWIIINNFLKNGYTNIQKAKNKKSLDEYVEELKFEQMPASL